MQRPFAFSTLPRSAGEPRTTTSDPRLFVKLTSAPSKNLRLEGFATARWNHAVNGNAGPLVAPEALSTARFPEQMQNLRLTWAAGPETLMEAQYGRFWLDPVNGPTRPATILGPPSR